MNSIFNNELRHERKIHGWSRKQLASVLGCDSATLSRLERGSVLPRLPTALCLEAVYRKPVAYLYPELYHELRDQVRKGESQLKGVLARRAGPPDYAKARL